MKLPKLYAGMRILASEKSYYVASDGGVFLTEAQAAEVIRRAEAHEGLVGLLKVARCPNTSCQDGAVPVGPDPDGDWQAEQCQWCYEREQAIAGEPK